MIFKHAKLPLILSLSAAVVLSPAQAQVNKEKVDSTLEFRNIPVDSQTSEESLFDLPDLPIPLEEATPKTTTPASGASSSASTAPTQLVVPLPPILDIGFTKNALPSLGKGTPTETETEKTTAPVLARLIDASRFDIAGIGLGMTPEEAVEASEEYGFTRVDTLYNIPRFLTWKYKEACQNEGYLIYNATQECIKNKAEKNAERYISEIRLANPNNQEKIKVQFTSSFGGNLSYKITYVSEGDYSLGTSAEAVFKKRERRKAFWQRVLEKYGMPSDLVEMLWTEGLDKPYLKASMNRSSTNGMLVLEEVSITDADTYGMMKANREISPDNGFSF